MKYVGAVVGGVIGAYVGGFSGAMYGAELGYGIGGIIDSSNAKITNEGPRLSDKRTTISENGVFIPRVLVHAAGFGGNIIDSTPLIEDIETSESDAGGKGGPTLVTKTAKYSATFRVLVCKSEGTHTLEWIKANGNLIWSASPTIDPAALLAAAGLVGRITVYDGADDQLADPFFEGLRGVGNEPGYLGILSVVFEGFQLANYANNIQATMLTFSVVEKPPEQTERLLNFGYRTARLDDDLSMWFLGGKTVHPISGPDLNDLPNIYRDFFDGAGPQRVGVFTTSDYVSYGLVSIDHGPSACPGTTYEQVFFRSASFSGPLVPGPMAGVWLYVNGQHTEHTDSIETDYQVPPNIICVTDMQTVVDEGVVSVNFYSPLGQRTGSLKVSSAGAAGGLSVDLQTWIAARFSGAPPEIGRGVVLCGFDGAGAFAYTNAAPTLTPIAGVPAGHDDDTYIAMLAGDSTFQASLLNQRACGLRVEGATIYLLVEHDYDATAGFRYSLHVYAVDPVTYSLAERHFWPGPRFLGGRAFMDLFLSTAGLPTVVLNGIARWSWAADGSVVTADMTVPDPSSTPITLAYKGDDFFVFEGQRAADADVPHNEPATLLHSNAVVPDGPRPLREFFVKLAAEKGFTAGRFDFTYLPDSVVCRGAIVTRITSPRVMMDYLSDLFRVDWRASGGQLVPVLRGGDAVREFTADELGVFEGAPSGDPPDAALWQTADELTLPRELQLKFTAIDSNYEAGLVVAKYEQTESQVVAALDVTAVMMTGDEAMRFAVQAVLDKWLEADTAQFTTTISAEEVEPADPVLLPGDIKKRRARLKTKLDKGGMIEWTGVRDDPSNLLSSQIAVGGGVPGSVSVGGNASIYGGPVARVDILNLPALRAADDDAGFFAFVYSTAGARFRGADVYDYATTIPNKVGRVVGGARVRGITVGALQAAPVSGTWDLSSWVDFTVDDAAAEPVSATSTAVYAGANAYLVGAEIVGARLVTVMREAATGVPAIWRLHGGLLRGRRGTDAAMGAHAAGDAVYLLNATALLRDRTASDAHGSPTVNVAIAAISTGRTSTDLAKFPTLGVNTMRALVMVPPSDVTYGEDGAGGLIFRWTRRSRLPFKFGTVAPLGASSESYAIDFGVDGGFAAGVTLYSSKPTLRIDAATRATLPTPLLPRVRQIGDAVATVPLTRPVRSLPPSSTVMPADTLPHLLLQFDPSSVDDDGALTDVGTAATPPATMIGYYAAVRSGRIVFSDQRYGYLSAFVSDARDEFGSRDWSIEFVAAISSRAWTIAQIDGLDGDGFSIMQRTGRAAGLAPGQMFISLVVYSDGRGGQTADSGKLQLGVTGLAGVEDLTIVAATKPGMNDGVERKYRFARSGSTFYASVDGVLVDTKAIVGDIPTFANTGFTFGPFRGSLGRVTVKTS